MADDGFNDATIGIGGDQTPLRSITYDVSAAAVEVSGAADANKLFVAGQADETVTFEIVGATDVAVSDAAVEITIAWGDSGSSTAGSMTTAVVIGVSISGSNDTEIISSVTCKRAS
jgi:hypothetical protein